MSDNYRIYSSCRSLPDKCLSFPCLSYYSLKYGNTVVNKKTELTEAAFVHLYNSKETIEKQDYRFRNTELNQ